MRRPTVYAVLGLGLTLAVMLLPVASPAEIYLEGYLGAAKTPFTGQTFSVKDLPVQPIAQVARLNYPGHSDTMLLGGLKLGTWFVKEGFLGYSGYPDWSKYFGFYMDFSYQRLYLRSQTLDGTKYVSALAGPLPAPALRLMNSAQ